MFSNVTSANKEKKQTGEMQHRKFGRKIDFPGFSRLQAKGVDMRKADPSNHTWRNTDGQ